jgi:pimeloyl-ACP methyl ester carboxylesterase
MSWGKVGKRVAVTGGATLAAAATFNAMAARGVEPLPNVVGGEELIFHWRGYRVAYTRQGSGEPLLLVHDLASGAWSWDWHRNAAALAANHTVYTLDLLGFGRSDRPAIRYSAALYLQLLSDFAARVIGEPCVLGGSGIAAAYAIELGARNPQRYSALVLSVPSGLVPGDDPGVSETMRLLLQAPIIGTAIYNATVTRSALRRELEPLFARAASVTPEMIEARYAAAHQPGARNAVMSLLLGHLRADPRPPLRRLVQPALLIWGRHAEREPVDRAHNFRAMKPDVRVEILDAAGDVPHIEQAEAFNEAALRFLDPGGGSRDGA